jgi:two-component system chemotaxis response regulator CheY
MGLVKKKKIFVLDSSPMYTQILRSHIENSTTSVETETVASRALLRVIKWSPDLLITGVEVGNINGYELCFVLKMIPDFAGMPIILMSAHDEDVVLRKAADAGADYYVHKDQKLVTNIKNAIKDLLPRSDSAKQQDAEKRTINSVLIVDDSSIMRKMIRNILTGIGIENIFEAADGIEGLEKLRESDVDLVLTDWNMPRMNGLDFIRSIRTNHKDRDLFIAMVTSESLDDIDQALEAGANGYLCKPFNVQGMKNLIAGFASNLQQ